MLIERLLAVFGLVATTALMLLGLRAEAITVGAASAALAASSRRP